MRELWIGAGKDQALTATECINNSVSVYCRGNSFLEFYLDACLNMGRTRERLGGIDVGTDFLSCLHELSPHPIQPGVVQLSPLVQLDLLAGSGPALALFQGAHRGLVQAANLCGSMQGKVVRGATLDERHFERVIECLRGRGAALLSARPVAAWQPAWTYPPVVSIDANP